MPREGKKKKLELIQIAKRRWKRAIAVDIERRMICVVVAAV